MSDQPTLQAILNKARSGDHPACVDCPSSPRNVSTAAYPTGMRVSEVLALQWDCVDFEREEIIVRRGRSGGKPVESPKTYDARRVPMHPILAEALREHRKQLLASQRPGVETNLVFPSTKGTERYASGIYKAYGLARDAAGIEQTINGQVLRRTMNTMLRRSGVDRIVLRSMMGHSSEEMTARYSWVDGTEKREAILKVLPLKAASGEDGEDGE